MHGDAVRAVRRAREEHGDGRSRDSGQERCGDPRSAHLEDGPPAQHRGHEDEPRHPRAPGPAEPLGEREPRERQHVRHGELDPRKEERDQAGEPQRGEESPAAAQVGRRQELVLRLDWEGVAVGLVRWRELLEGDQSHAAHRAFGSLALLEHLAAKRAGQERHRESIAAGFGTPLARAKLKAWLAQPDSRLRPVDAWLAAHPGWERAGDGAIARTYKLPDFAAALGFVVRVGCFAERKDHHPDVELGWGRARVAWSTHDAGGVTQLDLDAAEATDERFG